jgi:hypothetical protein
LTTTGAESVFEGPIKLLFAGYGAPAAQLVEVHEQSRKISTIIPGCAFSVVLLMVSKLLLLIVILPQ